MTERVWKWLRSDEARQAGEFAWWLGRIDEAASFRTEVEEGAGSDGGAALFASYFHGISRRDPNAASARLDELERVGQVEPKALVWAACSLEGDGNGCKRLLRLVSTNRVARPLVTAAMGGHFMGRVESADVAALMGMLASDEAVRTTILDGLHWRILLKKSSEPELADLAWTMLEA